MKHNIIAGLLAGAAILSGCAREDASSPNEAAQRYFNAWLELNHKGLMPTGNGIYVLEDKPGDGAKYNDELYVYVEYTIKSLDGTISSTTSEKLSQQIGTYNPSAYYGPKVLVAEQNFMTVGVEDMISDMRINGTKTAIIPSWLMTYNRYKNPEDYLDYPSEVENAIYTLTLRDMFKDVVKWEEDSLARSVKRLYPGLDTLEAGFYYKQLKAPSDTASFSEDTTIYINYIGRLLNGKVFDTSIADTAKFYGIYNPAKTYGPAEVRWAEDYPEITMMFAGATETSEVISGFSKTLWEMRPHEVGEGLFVSDFGYGTNGSGSDIPGYSPLRFWIEIVDKEE